MPVSERDVRTKLARHVISRATHPDVPDSLDGEVLLEEHRGPRGELLGVVSVSVAALLDLPDLSDDARKRERRDRAAFTYEEMVACDPKDKQGYNKYFEKWKEELKDAEHS